MSCEWYPVLSLRHDDARARHYFSLVCQFAYRQVGKINQTD